MTGIVTSAGLLRGMPLEYLALLIERGRRHGFDSGAVIVRQGQTGRSVFIVTRGRVRVTRSHPALTDGIPLAELGPGELVGEMAVLGGRPEFATVVALEETEAVEIDRTTLLDSILEHPKVAARLLQVVSQRVRGSQPRPLGLVMSR